MLDHNWNHALLKQNYFNTEKTEKTVPQSGKQDSFRHILKSSDLSNHLGSYGNIMQFQISFRRKNR